MCASNASVKIEIRLKFEDDFARLLIDGVVRSMLRMILIYGAKAYTKQTGRRCPGSLRTKRLRKKRLNAIMKTLPMKDVFGGFTKGGLVSSPPVVPPLHCMAPEPVWPDSLLTKVPNCTKQ